MILYLDTSALVKLYIDEEHHDTVRHAVNAAEAVATSIIAFTETRAAFARLQREARLSADALESLKQSFDTDWRHYAKISIDEELVRRAGDLADAFSLRGYDAVHLASAEYLRVNTGSTIAFACYDHRLRQAAAILGLAEAGAAR